MRVSKKDNPMEKSVIYLTYKYTRNTCSLSLPDRNGSELSSVVEAEAIDA